MINGVETCGFKNIKGYVVGKGTETRLVRDKGDVSYGKGGKRSKKNG